MHARRRSPTTVTPRRRAGAGLLLATLLLLLSHADAAAQVRGTLVFFDPSWAGGGRVAVTAGSDRGGSAAALSAAGLSWVGNCPRLALGAAAGIYRPDGAARTLPSSGVAGSYLINPCPEPLSAPNPTVRVMAGGGVGGHDRGSHVDGYAGIGVGFMMQLPVVRAELWATPRVHHTWTPRAEDGSRAGFAATVGVTLGVAGVGGIRAGADCCGRRGWGVELGGWF
jgi:hypothetical protein